jgi:peptide/nickel transport system permease protein
MEMSSAISKWKTEHEATVKEIRYSIHLIRQSLLTQFGLAIIIVLFFTAIFAPWLAPHDPMKVKTRDRLKPPSKEHLLGTDDMGRDILSRIISGSRISIMVGVVVVAISLSIGVPLGAISGYFGGKIDSILMRITDIFLGLPSLILALAIAAALGRGIMNTMIAISITWWPWYARLVRGQTLSIREMGYIEAARAAGGSSFRIVLTHVLPNCISPIIVTASMDMGYTILAAAALGFIGLGAQPPSPEWGLMVSIGRTYMMNYPWVATFPGLAILITVLGFNLVGDGLRDLLSPRLRR